MARRRVTKKGKIVYMPSEALQNYFAERLRLFKIQKKKEEGIELTEKEKKRIDNSARMKVHILNTIVFPAMTNLVYFFEKIYENQELGKLFYEDLRDLLDRTEDIPAHAKSGPIPIYSIRQTIFTRLITAALLLDARKDPKALKNPTDFRRRLVKDLQSIVLQKMFEIIDNDYGLNKLNQLATSVMEDVKRTLNWILFVTKQASYQKEKPEKILGFTAPLGPYGYTLLQ